MKLHSKITDVLAPLGPSQHQMYMSNVLQVADIIEFALDYTGVADVYVSSFSVSEEFLRRLYFIRKKGQVRSLQVVLDFKATQKTLLLWPFISQTVEDCRLADNHSKMLVVRSADSERIFAAVMSQNLTRGNRYECGSVTTDFALASMLLDGFNDIVKYHSIPFADVYRPAAESD